MSKIVLSKQPCPNCPSSDAYFTYDDGHGYCYSCTGTTFPDEITSYKSNNNEYTYEYIPLRGLTKNTLSHYGIKTKIDAEGKPVSIGFIYPNKACQVRYLDRKDFYWSNVSEADPGKAGLFGRDKFSEGSHKYVTITEGALDAASLYQVLRTPCVSVHSATSAVRDATVDRSWLNSFERVYLAFDGDTAGREAAAAVAKLFDYNKVFLVKFSKRKDANEYLQHGEDEELRNIWWNSKKYLPETIVSSFSEFETILKEQHKPSVSYPFPTLTEMTYGIRTGESVLITALEGVGKTEVMHAIEHHLLRETDDAIGAIYLEEPKRRHLQAIAGIEIQKPVHLPDSGCTEADILSAVQKAVRVDERLHLYSHFGSNDPEVLLDTIRFLVSARKCRYILFDHIGMAVSGLGGTDERHALDYISTRLEMMVKELDFALLFVSHVNDNGETRGSRYMSKIADIRIDLTRDIKAGSNKTHVLISKNRFSGKSGFAGILEFDPIKYLLSEVNDNTILEGMARSTSA